MSSTGSEEGAPAASHELNVTFVVTAFASHSGHADLAANCVLSIRRFYPQACIVVVLDRGSLPLKETHDGKSVADAVDFVVDNPYPQSGEYGSLCVACTHSCVRPGLVAVVQDSTVLRRPFTAAEVDLAKDAVLPMWNTSSVGWGWSDADERGGWCCFELVQEICKSEAIPAEVKETWQALYHSPRRTVVFGAMVVGPHEKLRALWTAGMGATSHLIRTRIDRCRVERLVASAILTADVGRFDPAHGKLSSINGCIVKDYPGGYHKADGSFVMGAFKPDSAFARWDDPQATDTEPVLLKRWQGR